MAYRNKTYVVFDGDKDMWAYAYMLGWIEREGIDFDFQDAHDLNVITDRASEEAVKRKLQERLANTKQVIVLVGENTKNLFKFVRWELEIAIELGLPIVVVNLNGQRKMDPALCPAILKDEYAVHVPFKAKIIQYALENFPPEHAKKAADASGARHYSDDKYTNLGL